MEMKEIADCFSKTMVSSGNKHTALIFIWKKPRKRVEVLECLMENFNTMHGASTEEQEIIRKAKVSGSSFLASPMIVKRMTSQSVLLNSPMKEHRQSIHYDGKEIGGERVTLS